MRGLWARGSRTATVSILVMIAADAVSVGFLAPAILRPAPPDTAFQVLATPSPTGDAIHDWVESRKAAAAAGEPFIPEHIPRPDEGPRGPVVNIPDGPCVHAVQPAGAGCELDVNNSLDGPGAVWRVTPDYRQWRACAAVGAQYPDCWLAAMGDGWKGISWLNRH